MSFEIGSGERGRFVWWEGRLIPESEKPKEEKRETHSVITDELDPPIQCMHCFHPNFFTSRSKYLRHLKEFGYRVTGGDHLKDVMKLEIEEMKKGAEKKEAEMVETVKQAVQDVKYDRVYFSEYQKELFKREERACQKENIPNPFK